ncbi:MAG: Mpo1-like protein [Burkholderiales bacterium]|jgi:hypothetical protein
MHIEPPPSPARRQDAACAPAAARPDFDTFYRDTFLPEHAAPANVALHVAGTLASAAFVVMALASGAPAWALAYPVVHAVPGLLGHRLFERNAAVGDLRVTRRDFPPWWFIAANHRLTVQVLRAGLLRSGRRSRR